MAPRDSLDGTELIRKAESGGHAFPQELGTALAEELLAAGADRILANIKQQNSAL